MSCCLAFRTKYIGTGYYWTAVVLLAFYWFLVQYNPVITYPGYNVHSDITY